MTTAYGTSEHQTIHHGENIKHYRKSMNLSQNDLAEMLGGEWTRQKISDIEKKPKITIRLIKRIATLLNVELENILYLEKPQMRNVQKNRDFTSYPTQNNQAGSIPPDRYFEAVEKNNRLVANNQKLYDELLQAERDKNRLEREKYELHIRFMEKK